MTKGRKKTHEQFVQEVFELVKNEYTVIGKYSKALKEIEIKHNKCQHIWKISPANFLSGHRCAKCFGKFKKTQKQFVTEVYDLVGHEYIVVGEYVNTNTKIKMKHIRCNDIFEVKPFSFLQGTGCPKCNGKFLKTQKQFIAEVHDLVGKEYSVLSEYTGANDYISMKHNECGYVYNIFPSSFLWGNRCPKCSVIKRSKKIKKTHEQFIAEVSKLVGNEYSILDKYINSSTKIKMKHNKCEHEWMITPSDFLQGYGCPKCKASKGETAIAKWLDSNSIYYKMQYKFDDCKYKLKLPFDFAIYLKDGSFVLIEFQGIQHYKSRELFGGDKAFKLTQKRDQIKRDYCENNNITLLEIPYWKFDNIDQILNDNLLPLDLMKQDNKDQTA